MFHLHHKIAAHILAHNHADTLYALPQFRADNRVAHCFGGVLHVLHVDCNASLVVTVVKSGRKVDFVHRFVRAAPDRHVVATFHKHAKACKQGVEKPVFVGLYAVITEDVQHLFGNYVVTVSGDVVGVLAQVHHRPPGDFFRHLDGQHFFRFGDVVRGIAHQCVQRVKATFYCGNPRFVNAAKHRFAAERYACIAAVDVFENVLVTFEFAHQFVDGGNCFGINAVVVGVRFDVFFGRRFCRDFFAVRRRDVAIVVVGFVNVVVFRNGSGICTAVLLQQADKSARQQVVETVRRKVFCVNFRSVFASDKSVFRGYAVDKAQSVVKRAVAANTEKRGRFFVLSDVGNVLGAIFAIGNGVRLDSQIQTQRLAGNCQTSKHGAPLGKTYAVPTGARTNAVVGEQFACDGGIVTLDGLVGQRQFCQKRLAVTQFVRPVKAVFGRIRAVDIQLFVVNIRHESSA